MARLQGVPRDEGDLLPFLASLDTDHFEGEFHGGDPGSDDGAEPIEMLRIELL
jgi:hypothetical protein